VTGTLFRVCETVKPFGTQVLAKGVFRPVRIARVGASGYAALDIWANLTVCAFLNIALQGKAERNIPEGRAGGHGTDLLTPGQFGTILAFVSG